MAKHTPAPWACDEVRTQVGRAFRIGSGEMLVAGKGCCIIYDDYPGNPDNERAANARLISAAPDLLAAAELAMEGVEVIDLLIASIEKHGNYSVESTLSFLNQARCAKLRLSEAIAKAEGRS